MLLFASALIIAGVGTQDPVLTVAGVVLALAGMGVFIVRQLRHEKDESDAGFDAKLVKFQAPASLVAVALGLALLLVGRGALTIGADDDSSDSASEPAVTTTVEPSRTVVSTSELPPPSTVEVQVDGAVEVPATEAPTEGEPLPDSLPVTGASGDAALVGLVMIAGGRWIYRSSIGVH